jgi:hypothetical protein
MQDHSEQMAARAQICARLIPTAEIAPLPRTAVGARSHG